jgi:phosphopantothenate-cysteine ligase
MKVLITSGGTKVKIDRVRDITNMSSGNFGSKIATEFLKLGHDVVFMKAKNSKSPFRKTFDMFKDGEKFSVDELVKWGQNVLAWKDHYIEYEYTTYEQYAEMLKFVIGVEQPDITLLAAAVSDYGVENYVNGKMRSNDMYTIKLTQLPKLISYVREWLKPNAKLIGFKMLVDSKPLDLIAAASRSLHDNKCNMVVANDLQDIKDNNHKLSLVTKNNTFQYTTDQNDPNYLAKMVVKHSLEV